MKVYSLIGITHTYSAQHMEIMNNVNHISGLIVSEQSNIHPKYKS